MATGCSGHCPSNFSTNKSSFQDPYSWNTVITAGDETLKKGVMEEIRTGMQSVYNSGTYCSSRNDNVVADDYSDHLADICSGHYSVHYGSQRNNTNATMYDTQNTDALWVVYNVVFYGGPATGTEYTYGCGYHNSSRRSDTSPSFSPGCGSHKSDYRDSEFHGYYTPQ